MLDLSIVIVGHNHRWCLEKTLDSLFSPGHGVEFEVVLIDNVSTDGTVRMARARFPEVTVICNEERHGFARNANTGIKAARRGRYLLLLNPDVKVLPGALQALVAFMDDHPQVGIAGLKLLNPDLTLQYSCRHFYNPMVPLLRFLGVDRRFPDLAILRKGLMCDWDHNESREVDFVTGACMALRREALAEVGLMDDRFFLYCEDQDLCLRMWQHGWKVYYVTDAVMIHDLQRHSVKGFLNKHQRAHIQSLIYLFRKHGLRIKRPTC